LFVEGVGLLLGGVPPLIGRVFECVGLSFPGVVLGVEDIVLVLACRFEGAAAERIRAVDRA
jgi:hypothetical protein